MTLDIGYDMDFHKVRYRSFEIPISKFETSISVISDIDIRYRSSGSTISVTYDIEEQGYRSFSYDIEVVATISKNYDIEKTSISKSETSISGCQGSR